MNSSHMSSYLQAFISLTNARSLAVTSTQAGRKPLSDGVAHGRDIAPRCTVKRYFSKGQNFQGQPAGQGRCKGPASDTPAGRLPQFDTWFHSRQNMRQDRSACRLHKRQRPGRPVPAVIRTGHGSRVPPYKWAKSDGCRMRRALSQAAPGGSGGLAENIPP